MKQKKWYAAWAKVLLSAIALLSLAAASISGVYVMWYGVGMNTFRIHMFEESKIINSLVRKGPGGRGRLEVAPNIHTENGVINPYIEQNNQTMVDIYSYYQYLNTPNNNATRSQTPEYYSTLYANTNIRARVVLVDAQGNPAATLCSLGGDWNENTILVDRMLDTYIQNPIWFEIGFDKTFPASDFLAREKRGYETFVNNQNMLLIILVVSGVFFFISVFFLLRAAGHRKDDTQIHLRFFDHWALALLMAPLALALTALFIVGDELIFQYQYFMWNPMVVWNSTVSCMILAGILWLGVVLILFGLRTVLVRIKAHRLWSTTLCYYVFSPIRTHIRKERTGGQEVNTHTQPLIAGSDLNQKDGEAADASPRFSVDGEKVQAAVQELAHKTQDTVQGLAHKTQGAVQYAVRKAKTFEWEGSRIQRILHQLWHFVCRMVGGIQRILSRLGLIGQGMLCGVCIVFGFLMIAAVEADVMIMLMLLIFSVFVLLGLYWVLRQIVRLQTGTRKLSEGDLSYQVDTGKLHGPFRTYAEYLNHISKGMLVEVERCMKSERLKTELLTNVSHDIKTPLTSIINYVDLLKKQEMESEQAKEYVEVLERQSHRLKKLLEDLIEASKAATGNITVELAKTDAAELLRQVEGEYNERLVEHKLIPILRIKAEVCSILTDGRLLWRVFDNLLGNIVKYAMPGTRVYLDLSQKDDRCIITIRNISRDELGIEAEELMERFVRGDAARATEGSGLGLSIARSLTESMNGGFNLMLDGDLFKVILDFPLV